MSGQVFRRILVALDASPLSHAALEEAAVMAAGLSAELTGIFVVDTELLRLSALPVAHETGLTSARRRTLDPDSMERALKVQANQARLALEKVANRHRLQSSFYLGRGNVVSELTEAARQADLIAMGVIGHMGLVGKRLGSTARGVRALSRCSLLLTALDDQHGGPVVVVCSASADSSRALEFGVELAERRNSELVVLLCGSGEERTQLKTDVRERLTGVRKVTFDETTTDGFDDLNALLGRHNGGLLIVGEDCALVAGHDEELGALRCPVLLARSAIDERSDPD